MLPNATPALVTLLVLSFLANWNDFIWPIYVLFSPERLTLPVGLSKLQGAYTIDYPVIMAGAMFLQYKLQPPTADPIQQKVFMIMPLVMSVTFAFFPAGLVLYWATNGALGLLQQWVITRRHGEPVKTA